MYTRVRNLAVNSYTFFPPYDLLFVIPSFPPPLYAAPRFTLIPSSFVSPTLVSTSISSCLPPQPPPSTLSHYHSNSPSPPPSLFRTPLLPPLPSSTAPPYVPSPFTHTHLSTIDRHCSPRALALLDRIERRLR